MQTKTNEPKLGINLQRAIKQFNEVLNDHSIQDLIVNTKDLNIPESIKHAIITAEHSSIMNADEVLSLALIIHARRLNGNRIGELFTCDLVDILSKNEFYWSDYYYNLAINCLSSIKQSTIDKYKYYLSFPN